MKKLGQAGKCWDEAEKEFKLEKYASCRATPTACPSSRGATAACGAAAPDRLRHSKNKNGPLVASGPFRFVTNVKR